MPSMPGQAEVEHDQVGEEGLGVVERLRAVGGELDVVALHAQRALEDLGDLLIVLDDEHANGPLGGFHAIDTRPAWPAERQLLPLLRRQGPARRRRRGFGPRCRPPAVARSPSPRPPEAAGQARARRSAPSWQAGLPKLEQRHFDVIGLGLVATAIFLAFVVYLDWDGGQAGDAAVDGLRVLIGAVHYLVPAALMAAGAILVLRPVLPAVRPFRTGAICLFLGVTLALAAGTLGLGPGGATVVWDAEWVKPRGGMAGEGLYYVTSTFLGTLGAHTIAIFLLAAAVLLLTGASIAGVVKATTDSFASDHARGAHRRPAAPPRHRGAVRARAGPAAARHRGRAHVPRATRRRSPTCSATPRTSSRRPRTRRLPAAREAPRLAEDPEEDEPGVARTTPDPEDLTPQGRYRATRHRRRPTSSGRCPTPPSSSARRADASKPDTAGQEKVAAQLTEALGHFGIEAKVIGMVAGPHITRYELRLAPGIKVAKVAQLKDDLAYALAASDIRILAPIPGKQAVGVEVPNARRRIVHLGDVLQETPAGWSPLTVWLGKDVAGRAIGADLAKMPHLLVAGTTGAGKSGCVNAMLASVLARATPHELRLVLVDPKQVELNHYDSIPHLLTPVITSPRKAATALQNLVREMEQRYSYMSLARTRSLIELNKVTRRAARRQPLPYILCVIDELADLMMVAPADVEDSIIRLAQKARAVGIHLVLATQSPRVDVITGMIKANVPSRIAFSVSSQTDSRVILDQNGAESLLGQGDMLFSPVGTSRLQRIQGAYVDESEIEKLTDAWRRQGEPEFREELLEEVEEEAAEAAPTPSSTPTRIRCSPTRSASSPRCRPRRPRCSSAACGSATRAPAA